MRRWRRRMRRRREGRILWIDSMRRVIKIRKLKEVSSTNKKFEHRRKQLNQKIEESKSKRKMRTKQDKTVQ